MKVTRFDPKGRLLVVGGTLWGPRGATASLRLAVDTGSTETILMPEILDEIGYSPRQGEAITAIRSVVGVERGYLLRVARFRALGHEFSDFRIDAHDLPEGFGINGLLGLSFLRHFNYEVRSADGRIRADRLTS